MILYSWSKKCWLFKPKGNVFKHISQGLSETVQIKFYFYHFDTGVSSSKTKSYDVTGG